MNSLSNLHRLEYKDIPVYILPEKVDWFIPSSRMDHILQAVSNSSSTDDGLLQFCRENNENLEQVFHDYSKMTQVLVNKSKNTNYKGRAYHLKLNKLKELWFHLTDKCNLSCRHCLFGSSPAKAPTLQKEQLIKSIDQGFNLGVRLFYFTGGEPFIYPDLIEIIQYVLEKDLHNHVVVLTNGLLLENNLDKLLSLDHSRLHLQVSLDGLEDRHDYLRGKNSFARLVQNIKAARDNGLGVTVSVAVNSDNVEQLPDISRLINSFGITSMHLMYHFVRGKGSEAQFVDIEKLFAKIEETSVICTELGLNIDNLEILKSQIFSMPGTHYDLSNAGWESLAIGPDGRVYPSPALVGIDEVACGLANEELEKVWRESEILKQIRQNSLINSKSWQDNPLNFLTGGGDPDHSYIFGNEFIGHDPYIGLHVKLAMLLITEHGRNYPDNGLFRLRMGDLRFDCPDGDESGSDGTVKLTHCNCVISLAENDGHTTVMEFYGEAANEAKTDIVNPFGPDAGETGFIPEKAKQRSYGCGSPVQEGAPQAGETVVDLGSGSGVECFIAASKVGSHGKVYGIDMTDDMLKLAKSSQAKVIQKLGYDNVEFRKGYLENIPLPDNCADLIISNCVINLSPDKRATYLEIIRVLKPGGRLVVSDIVTDEPVSSVVKNSARMRGECLGGAMQQNHLTIMLEDCGFSGIYFHKRSPYRKVKGNKFFSLTYQAEKSMAGNFLFENNVHVMYRGPGSTLCTDRGNRLDTGSVVLLPASEAASLKEAVFQLGQEGEVTNIDQEPCNCGTAPEETILAPAAATIDLQTTIMPLQRQPNGCMQCGSEIIYEKNSTKRSCSFCGITEQSNSTCKNNHYICDSCHKQEAMTIINHICLTSKDKDLFSLFSTIRNHPAIPLHGPEHHSLIPGIILAVYRNNGGEIDDETIKNGIERAKKIPGGVCGFWGSCGAAIGAGIATAMILNATPLTAVSRQKAQNLTAKILTAISQIKGGRCCQRESWITLSQTALLSQEFLGIALPANHQIRCNQYHENKECIKVQCPLWDK
ncbi:MAG: DUF5714 domain-containing protein [Desulfobulbaceae bacterium]|nr:DUF5714 domain-containing protein [Desulfobulbaceae bacterium]